MVEITNNLQLLPLIMLVLLISKAVGDAFNNGFYEEQVKLRSLPLFDSRPQRFMRTLVAKDAISTRKVVQFSRVSKLGHIVSVLRTTDHNGFPVVEKFPTGEPVVIGLILRSYLLALLQAKADFQHTSIPGDIRYPVKLISDMTEILQSQCQVKVYSLFRQLGLRHICVVPRRLVCLQTVLLVGMKLQQIITSFALDVMGGVEKKNSRKRGSKRDASVLRKNTSDLKLEKIHPIKPRDDLFWFHRPKLLLYLVHFMLLQNAFEFAFFFWGLVTYGFSSCLVGNRWMIIVLLLLGVLVQILCSVSTLPLYALVSQLGSSIRMNAVLSEGAVSAIHNWRNRARKKRKARDQGDDPDSDQTLESPRDSTDTYDHSTIDIELPHTNGLLHHLHKL